MHYNDGAFVAARFTVLASSIVLLVCLFRIENFKPTLYGNSKAIIIIIIIYYFYVHKLISNAVKDCWCMIVGRKLLKTT